MLVVDCSAVADLLLVEESGAAVAQAIADDQLVAPEHLTIELLSVLRGWNLSGQLSDKAVEQAIVQYLELGVEVFPVFEYWGMVWQMRHSISAYDAAYVALARKFGCALVTRDQRLSRAASDCAIYPT